MKGLIDQQMGSPQQTPQYKSAANKALPPEMQDDFERTVIAGLKVFYAPEMREEIQQGLQGDGPIEKKLAEGITGLMALLDKQAKPGLPIMVIIPAAVELMYEAIDFLQKVQAIPKLTPEQFSLSVQLVMAMIGKRYGMSPQQIAEMLTGKAGAAPNVSGAPPPTAPIPAPAQQGA